MTTKSPAGSAQSLPPVDLLRIDEACDHYERALQSGEKPSIAESVEGFEDESRAALLGELLLIELHHRSERREQDASLVKELGSECPELTSELEAAMQLVKQRIAPPSMIATVRPSRAELVETAFPAADQFEIVCPHCRQPCPISHELRDEAVTCAACGTTFNLQCDSQEAEQAVALKELGHFRLTSRIGMGGCGAVWKAHDSQLDRTVAIKIPRFTHLREEDRARFLQEARAVARLKHPNIVPVHEFGREGDLFYFVSDYVRGESLASWLTTQRMTVRDAMELSIKLADALHYAHQQGVVHRDIKPSNILLDLNGEPHITDFGLAKLEQPSPDDVEGALLGTPAYMSPEQAAGQAYRCDARTDVYALGVVLFQLLTGELPFRGDREMLLYQIQAEQPESPRKLNARTPKDLETICLKCLQKPMGARYESAGALAEDLRRHQRGEPIAARPVSAPVHAWRWCLRNPAATAALALLLLVSIVSPIIAVQQLILRQQRDAAHVEKDKVLQTLALLGASSAPKSEAAPARAGLVENTLIDSAFRHTAARADGLSPQQSDVGQLAYLRLAAAILAQAQGSTDEALRRFQAASESLASLRDGSPARPGVDAALAFCRSRATELMLSQSSPVVDESTLATAGEAADAWRGVVQKAPDDFTYRRLEADALVRLSLAQALREQGRDALAGVKQVKQRTDAIGGDWPDEAERLYLIACELTGSTPLLTPDRASSHGGE